MWITLWLRAMRARFLQASILPVALGSALAYRDGRFSWEIFGIMALAMAALNIGTNLTNDLYDHLSGADARNPFPTRFSGGSRVIQNGLLPPEAIGAAAKTAYLVGILLGLYLAYRTDGWVLAFGATGAVLSYFYTAPPLRLGYHGWGEPLVGMLLGPLAVMGAYYVHARAITEQAFFLSLPLGFLVTAILYINQFPDAGADAAAGKRHWVARFGRERAVKGYPILVGSAYGSLLLAVAWGILPFETLWALATAPFAVWATWILRHGYDRPGDLLPAMGMTIGIHLAVGLLLILALLWG